MGHISSNCPNARPPPPPNNRPLPRLNNQAHYGQNTPQYGYNNWSEPRYYDESAPDNTYFLNKQEVKEKPIIPLYQNLDPYAILQDLQNTKANITFGQLLQVAPEVRKDLIKGMCKPKEENINVFNNQPSTRTTALCCSASIGKVPITLIVNTGASGSVVSKCFLDDHGFKIE